MIMGSVKKNKKEFNTKFDRRTALFIDLVAVQTNWRNWSSGPTLRCEISCLGNGDVGDDDDAGYDDDVRDVGVDDGQDP